MSKAPAVYTEMRFQLLRYDTGWRIHGQKAHLMGFDTDQATVFATRPKHPNEEVRELIPANFGATRRRARLRITRQRSNDLRNNSPVAFVLAF